MDQRRLTVKLTLGGIAACCATLGARDAAACGGCFHPPTQTVTDITDERMLLAVSTTQSTLYDQIQYSGSPSSFAWVLPIHGTVDVGLSADVLFDSIDTLTATQIIPPESTCPPLPSSCLRPFAGAGGAVADASAAATAPAVTVTKQENVGPYATVQLHATDSSALSNWLADNGFVLPDAVAPVIAAYVSENFDFLAMKLLPNQNVQAMRPVRVTTQGASLSLPLRMASIGTGVSVGISIWVVSDGRYEPANFPLYHIDDSDLVWDWSTSSSNYTALRAQHESGSDNANWEIESSIDVNEQLISNTILSGGVYYQGGGLAAVAPSDPSADYLPVTDPDAGADAAPIETADQVRQDDLTTLFAGLTGATVRITRMRSDIAQAAMTTDFNLQASSDQSELSNVRNVTTSINEVCNVYGPNCQIIGQAPAGSSSSDSGAGTGSGASGDAGVSITPGGGAIGRAPVDAGASAPADASVAPADASVSANPGKSASGGSAPTRGASSSSRRSGDDGDSGVLPLGGCSVSPSRPGRDTGGTTLGGLAAAFALVFSRGARARRRRSRM